MKIKIRTKKPEEMEKGFQFVKENLKEHTKELGKFKVAINVEYRKLDKDIFEVTIDYTSKIPLMTNVIDYMIKNLFFREMKKVDSEIKEI